MPEEGTWVDVAELHEPVAPTRRKKGFEHGVGLEGYERGTGEEVVREPSFKRPGDRRPATPRPFED